jgi:glucose-1-phosphatase
MAAEVHDVVPYDVVLFDLGGVLARFGGVASMRQLAGIEDDAELWRRWLSCPWVRSFERGMCSSEEFAVGVVSDWSLSVTPERFVQEFSRWLTGPFPGAEELVTDTRRSTYVACLSNTNALHWEAGIATWPLMDLFHHSFLSFEIGMLKPDAEAFHYACRQLDAEPSRVLFLDDNLINVEAAKECGLRAVQVRGVEEARAALIEARVLNAGSR